MPRIKAITSESSWTSVSHKSNVIALMRCIRPPRRLMPDYLAFCGIFVHPCVREDGPPWARG